ncbi:MAG: 2-dehydro-3-deoxyglucarate aldolase [Sphingopyxis sp.]|uniref:aldolase/citrate lyase family protein n=1 Tax=Sphingopyxis sp. TaxID=1908224 RepID=UPI001A2FD595|nr:aldolase/citrate lyase family protein [Sphingopyxis sp.]MBJ7499340.1 2-dehydro-3-deoxyglucarate aldolase [Sphingopyxis sp.]
MNNRFKHALRAEQAQIGFWQGLGSAYTAEICAGAGFDWLLFDGEHSPTDIPILLSQLHAVSGTGAHAVGRPPVGTPWLIKQYLDLGFQTLLIPMVNSADEAAELVRACRYPPIGVRGVATSRASRWGRDGGYLAEADDEICLLVQVETREAIDEVAAIAAVDGVDGVFIGPSDLSASLGHRGNAGHPDVTMRIEAAIGAILAAGKAPGILSADVAAARRYLELGCLFVAVGTDMGLMVRATDALAAQFGRGTGEPVQSATTY